MHIERHGLSSRTRLTGGTLAEGVTPRAGRECDSTDEQQGAFRGDPVERLLDDRVRQGLPRTITDPAVLARVASILRAARRKSAA